VSTAARRRPASAVPAIKRLLISPPNAAATLVDISTSGLLAEVGAALKVGQTVKVNFEGTFTPAAVEAQVVRSAVAAVTSAGIRYHVGFAFKTPIALDDEPEPETGGNDEMELAPAADLPAPAPVVNRW
jgi:PilZ domain-containing protein